MSCFLSCKPEAPDPITPDDVPVQNDDIDKWAFDAENHWHDESDFAKHEWKETITKEASYEEDGETQCVCKVCGYEKTKVIAKLSHIHTFSDEWESDSGFHWHSAICGHDEKSCEEEHNWEETTLKEPTKTETGLKKLQCLTCGYEKTEVIPDFPPDEVTNITKIKTDFESAEISWKNPDDVDFEKVIVTYGNGNKYEISGNPSEIKTANFTGLTNGLVNTFVIYAVDKNGNKGKSAKFDVPIHGGISGYPRDGKGQKTVLDDLTINTVTYDKTSEVIIVPSGTFAVVAMTDDSSWNTYYKNLKIDPYVYMYYGAFVKDRKIKISPYILGQYEVTSELYEAIMGNNPNSQSGSKYLPVEYVSWYDACIFCNKLTEAIFGIDECVYYLDKELTIPYSADKCHPQKKEFDPYTKTYTPIYNPNGDPIIDENSYYPVYPAYDYVNCKWTKKGYRLPSEVEWEFAARGGDPNSDCWSYAYAGRQSSKYLKDGDTNIEEEDDTNIIIHDEEENIDRYYAWYDDGIKPVGFSIENRLGLFDMSGNVAEWCYDIYESAIPINAYDSNYYDGIYISNPIGSTEIMENTTNGYYFRSIRSVDDWSRCAYTVTVSYRNFSYLGLGKEYIGFRLARSLD